MKKISLAVAGMAALVASMASTTAQAAMRLWTINNAKFDDGGSWTGSFEWDATTNTFGNYSWTVSGGDETTFPAFTFTNANAVLAPSYAAFTSDTPINLFVFTGPTTYPDRAARDLYLVTTLALPDADGTRLLNVTDQYYSSVDCYECAPVRYLTSGFLTSGTGGVPEPANWALMIGGIGMIGAGGRYARRKMRVAFA